jgi:hypothetical protein
LPAARRRPAGRSRRGSSACAAPHALPTEYPPPHPTPRPRSHPRGCDTITPNSAVSPRTFAESTARRSRRLRRRAARLRHAPRKPRRRAAPAIRPMRRDQKWIAASCRHLAGGAPASRRPQPNHVEPLRGPSCASDGVPTAPSNTSTLVSHPREERDDYAERHRVAANIRRVDSAPIPAPATPSSAPPPRAAKPAAPSSIRNSSYAPRPKMERRHLAGGAPASRRQQPNRVEDRAPGLLLMRFRWSTHRVVARET